MRTFILSFSVLACLLVNSSADEGDVRFLCQVFKLSGDFESETSLSKQIWRGSPKTWKHIKDEVTLFDKGQFKLGKDTLRIDRQGCHWNDTKLTFEEGHKASLPEEKLSMIFSPDILRKQGQTARLKVKSSQPFEYMTRTKGGLYALKETALPVGMVLEFNAKREGDKHFLISHLEVDLRTVSGRENVKGTKLPVGLPKVDERTYKLKIHVREHKNYGILIQPKGSHGAIIIRMEIEDK